MSRKTDPNFYTRGASIGFSVLLLLFGGAAFGQASLSDLVTDKDRLKNLDLCEGLIEDKEPRRVDAFTKPPFGQRYVDPAFGTTVIRITKSAESEVLKPAYSTMQAWNADESLLLLYRQTKDEAGHILLDGFTYEPIKKLDFVSSDLEEVFWSHNDPDTLFFVNKSYPNIGDFMKMNVRSGEKTIIRNFSDLCGEGVVPTSGNDVHMQSLDDDKFGFRCDTGEDWTMFTYSIKDDKVVSAELGESRSPFDNWTAPQALASGNGYWMQGRTIEPDLKTIRSTIDAHKYTEHGDLGTSWDGREVIYMTAFDPSAKGCTDQDVYNGVGHLIEHDLNTGACRPVINEKDDYPYTTRGTHISGRAIHKPGWVAMSSIGYDSFHLFTQKRKAPALFSEIYLVDTNPNSERVCRVAQHRSYSKSAENGEYHPYFGEPHATISPSGTRIVFGSDWYDSGSVDTYVVELPAYKTLIGAAQ